MLAYCNADTTIIPNRTDASAVSPADTNADINIQNNVPVKGMMVVMLDSPNSSNKTVNKKVHYSHNLFTIGFKTMAITRM